MNLTNIDQTIKQFECPNKTKCDINLTDIQFKQEQKFDSLEYVQSNTKLKQFQKDQLYKQNVQENTYQQVDKNVEENNSQNLESNSQSLQGNDKKNDSNYSDFLNKSNTLFASIQQVIDMQRLFELEKNELEQRIKEQRIHEELNLRQKLFEYEQNVNLFNVQRNEFNKKLQETQQLFKLSNIIDQKDNQQEIIIKLIQENYTLTTKINNIINEQTLKQNEFELKIDHLLQQLQQNHIQKENFKIKYLNLKQNCRKKINKIKQSITQLIEIKQSFNFQFNRIHNFNNQILEQLQVFINQRQELEQMEKLNQSNIKLIKQLKSSQNQLIQERQQFQKILNIKQVEFQQLQIQSQEIKLQNQIQSEQLKSITYSQQSHLDNQNNKFIDLKNDCEDKSEYADENYGMNNNDEYEIDYQNTKDQELLSEEPGNDSIDNNNNNNQQQNIYLEGESQIEEDSTKKDNLLSLKLSDLNTELQGQSISQKMEFIKKDNLEDKFKQIDDNDNDQDIPDIQFDDDLNDVLVQINTDQNIKQVILKDETPLDNNIIDFDQVVQQLEENNQQSGWDFEGI